MKASDHACVHHLGLEQEDPEDVFDVHGRVGTGAFGYDMHMYLYM